MFDIIAIGDGQFLYQILNFLALLNSSNMFAQLAMLGALLGIVFSLLQSITTGGRDIPIASTFVGVMLFMVMFGQSTTVTVEDYYSGRTRVIDNVPMGTAIVGSLISQVGIGITDKFMQASAVPGSERLPYQYTLDALMASRDLTDGSFFKDPETRAFARTAQEYISQCAMQIYRGNGNRWPEGNDPTTADDAWLAMKSNSQSYTMQNFMDQGEASTAPDYMTCANGWTMLNSYMSSSKFQLAVETIVKRSLHRDIGDGGDINGIYTDVFASLNQSGTDAQLWLKNSVVANIARKGVQQSVGKDDVASAVIVETAVNQRNVQFSAESSLWLRMARGIMTFFEGVGYGMAPFAALLIPFGAYGLRIGLRYVALLLWIFLWTPLLAFVNMFTIDALSGQLDALQTVGGAPLHSIIGIMEAQYTAMDYIGISGWMAPTVASLAGLLVFGGLAGFNSLAGRVNGADFVKEDQVAPAALSTGALMSRQAAMTGSPGEGTITSGAATTSWVFGDVASTSAAFRQTASQESFATFGELLKNGLTNAATVKDAYNQAASVLDSRAASSTVGVSATDAQSVSNTDSAGSGTSADASRESRNTDTLEAGGRLGVSAGKGGVGVGGSVGGRTQTSDTAKEGSGMSMDSRTSVDTRSTTGLDERATADKAFTLAKALSEGTVSAAELGVSADRAAEVTAAAQKAYRAGEAYEESTALTQTAAASLTIGEGAGSQALAQSGNLGKFVDAAQQLAPSFQERLDGMRDVAGSGQAKYASQEQNLAAAALLSLGDAAHDRSLPESTRALAADMQTQALGYAAGGSTGGASLSGAVQRVGAGSSFSDTVGTHVTNADSAEASAQNLVAPNGSGAGVFGEAGAQVRAGQNAYNSTNIDTQHSVNSANVNAIGEVAQGRTATAAMGGQLESRMENLGLGDDWRTMSQGLMSTNAGQLTALETTTLLSPEGLGTSLASSVSQAMSGGGIYTPAQVAVAESFLQSPGVQAGNAAYADYPELAAYSALSGMDVTTRELHGVNAQMYAAMGSALSTQYGAETVAAVSSMGAVGLDRNPEFANTAAMINDHLKSNHVEPMRR